MIEKKKSKMKLLDKNKKNMKCKKCMKNGKENILSNTCHNLSNKIVLKLMKLIQFKIKDTHYK
jgi:hypothetical protein